MSQDQNSHTIKNPTVNKPANVPTMNDRDRINDILLLEKYLTDSFNISAREASHPSLHQDIMTVLNETHQRQYELYELMFRKGHYKLEAEEQNKLEQTHMQFSDYTAQFPYGNNTVQ